jgi:DNA-binding transcriptional MerR regulator
VTDRFLNPAEAARRLGVSAKALRLYEERGLIRPARTAGGWRAYGPAEMDRGGEIAALRALGFSLAQVERVLAGQPENLEPTLAAHQARLEAQLGALSSMVKQVARLRADLVEGRAPSVRELAALTERAPNPIVVFDLSWPWGGERFELPQLPALTYLTGPLGSGKTRLAMALAEHLSDARFVGLDRAAPSTPNPRVEADLAWLIEDGAVVCDALVALLSALEADGSVLVVDLVEQGLDEPTQLALAAWLRRRPPEAPRLILMTRSSAILDLDAVGPDTAILFCPANHSPPRLVEPRAGAPGYEAVTSCLACPGVRARTAGMEAVMPAA